MQEINLGYGKKSIPLRFDESRLEILGEDNQGEKSLSDAEIGALIDAPINSLPLEEIVAPGETVLIVVPDATRASASGQIVNLLVRRLIASGTMPFDIRIIFATGIHRAVTEAEKVELLTPFIVQRIKTLRHNPRDLTQIVNFGETASGIKIELNRALIEHDKIILIGGISWHYFAGFGGGRKLICPGLASVKTVNETHKLAFDFEKKTRRAGVGAGLLQGNAVHEVFTEIADKIKPHFAVNSIVNDRGEATNIFCGDYKSSFEKACAVFAENFTVGIPAKRDVVIASCGGFPHDLNLIQAHKTLETATHCVHEGGTIIWLAECAEGLGRKDFLQWFEVEHSTALADLLGEKYQVNGQTAWSLMRKLEKFNVVLITDLPKAETAKMRIKTAENIEEVLTNTSFGAGYILPFGAKFLPVLK